MARDTDGDAGIEHHREFAAAANNAAWELLDGRDLTADEVDELLGRVYAAAHHWRRATPPGSINNARAAWLCSRAHAVLGHGDLARHHAERCAELTKLAGDAAAGFDRAYALEARARALACLGHTDEAAEVRAAASAIEIADDEDRSIVDADLAAEPWFGLSSTDR